MQFLLADVVASRLFPSKEYENKTYREWDAFPELFAEEKRAFEESQAEEEFESFKLKRRRFAAEHNKHM